MDFSNVYWVLALGACGAVAIGIRYARQRAAVWREAGKHLGLRYRGMRWMSPARLTGSMEGAEVTVDVVNQSSGRYLERYTRFRVHEPRLPESTTVAPAAPAGMLKRVFGQEPLETGDPTLDARVHLSGPALERLRTLDARTRGALLKAVALTACQLDKGVLRADVRCDLLEAATIVETTRSLVRTARLLADACTAPLPSYLQTVALADPLSRPRLRALQALSDEAPGSPELARAAAHALREADPMHRLLAARLAGADGRDTLETLARLIHIPEHVRVRALTALVRRDGPDVSAARWEDPLVRLLDSDDAEVRTRAARALGHAGTVRAVQPLLERTGGLLTSRELKDAAREAVALIQGRIDGAGAGLLALADDGGAGGLSLAEQGGSLSLSDDS